MRRRYLLSEQATYILCCGTLQSWVLGAEFDSCDPSATYNFEVAPGFLEKNCAPLADDTHCNNPTFSKAYHTQVHTNALMIVTIQVNFTKYKLF